MPNDKGRGKHQTQTASFGGGDQKIQGRRATRDYPMGGGGIGLLVGEMEVHLPDTTGSINGHTDSAFMAKPPPKCAVRNTCRAAATRVLAPEPYIGFPRTRHRELISTLYTWPGEYCARERH